MAPMWAILKRFLFSWTRIRANLMYMFVMPIVFVFVFGVVPSMGNNKVPVAVVNQDHSTISTMIVQKLEQLPDYHVSEISAAEVPSVLREFKASVAITLPSGLQKDILEGNSPKIGWLLSPNSSGFGQATGSLLQLQQKLGQWITFGTLNVRQAEAARTSGTAAVKGATKSPAASIVLSKQTLTTAFQAGLNQAAQVKPLLQAHTVSLSEGKVQTKFIKDNQRVMIGFATMFIIFTVFGTIGSLFTERDKGTWSRLKASPASRASILAGYGLGFFAIGWIQFLVLYLAARFLFGIVIPLNPTVVLLISLYVLAVCGIALTVAGTVKTNEQHMVIGSFIGIGTSMIGGAYWPLEIEPTWMQHLAWFVPQSWALSGIQSAALGLASTTTVALPLVVLAAFGLIFFTVGMIQLRYS